MSNDPVRTFISVSDYPEKELAFQHYFVREQCKPKVNGFYFKGIENAQASESFISALEDENLDAIVICPSNPFVSVDPILKLQGITEKLRKSPAPVIAVSPIINGQAIKGPTAKMMEELTIPKTSQAIATHYRHVIDYLVLDNNDTSDIASVEKEGIKALTTQTLMKSTEDKINLAQFILNSLN